MKTRDIYDVRASVEDILRDKIGALDKSKVRPRVIVTVTPGNEIDVMVVSSIFEGTDIQDRDDLLWPALERSLSPEELDRIDRWDLLTVNEAKKVYPSSLKAKSRSIEIASEPATASRAASR